MTSWYCSCFVVVLIKLMIGDSAMANWHSTGPYWLESDYYWIIMSRGSSLIWISEMGLRLPCPWRSTRRTGSHFLLEQTFLLWYNYEMAKKMTIIVKILMRSWILDKASISKCWINIREDENADHQTLIFFIPKRGHMKLQNSRRHFAQCFSFSITCLSPLLRYTRSPGHTLVIGCHFHCLTIVRFLFFMQDADEK